jgi:hypothetical protein
MKKLLTVSVLILSLASSMLFSQSLSIKPGYQLLGAADGVVLEKLDGSCVNYLFNFKDNQWRVYIADGQDYGVESNLTAINRGDGFWAYGSSECEVEVNSVYEEKIEAGTPYIKNATKMDLDENSNIVATLSSEGSEGNVTFKIVGGADHYLFEIDENNKLKFKTAPDFEKPDDLLADNSYEVKVEASDGTLKSEKTFTITVNDTKDYFRIENEYFDVLYSGSVSHPSYNYSSSIDKYLPSVAGAKGEVTYHDGTYIDPNGSTGTIWWQSTYHYYTLQKTWSDGAYVTGDYNITVSLTDEGTGETIEQNILYTVTDSRVAEVPTTTDIHLFAKVGETVELPLSGIDPNGYHLELHPSFLFPNDEDFPYIRLNSFDINDSRITAYTANGVVSGGLEDKGKLEYKEGKWYFTAYEAGDDNFIHFKYYALNGLNSNFALDTLNNQGSHGSDVNITIVDNYPPEVQDMTLETYEDTTTQIVLTAYDKERDIVTYTLTAQNGTVTPVTDVYGENRWNYTPNKNFNGVDTITYKANDGTIDSYEKTITITVDGINDKPTIDTPPSLIEITPEKVSQYSEVLDANSLFFVNSTLAKDGDQEDLNFTVETAPENGTLKVYPDGGIVYAPNYNYTGSDSFSLFAKDASNEVSNSVTFYVSIVSPFKTDLKKIAQTGSTVSVDPYGMERSVENSNLIQDDPTTQRGEARSFTRSFDGVVTDAVTGLMWQDNADNMKNEVEYDTFQEKNVHTKTLKPYTYDEAQGYCNGLSLGGYGDWRIPSEIEMKTLIDYSKSASATYSLNIGTTPIFQLGNTMVDDTFEYTAPNRAGMMGVSYSRYWTTTQHNDYPIEDSGKYRAIEFGTYLTSRAVSSGDTLPGVMCVRGTYSKESQFIKDEKEGILFDVVTGLMWQANDEHDKMLVDDNNVTYSSDSQPFRSGGLETAVAYCENLSLGGYDDWKLPNINELLTLSSDELSVSSKAEAVSSKESYSARELQLGEYLSSTPLVKSAKTSESLEEYFYFDDNGNFLGNGSEITTEQRDSNVGYDARGDLPFMDTYINENENAFLESNDTNEDFLYDGINFKACRDAVFKGGSVYYEGRFNWIRMDQQYISLEESYDCRLARAKYCKANGGHLGKFSCWTTKPSDDTSYSASFPHGTIGENQYADVRCVRNTSDKGEAFYNSLKTRVLNTAPQSVAYSYDKDKNQLTNTINGYKYTRYEEANDGNITDNLTGVTLLKDYSFGQGSDFDSYMPWSEANSLAKNIGAGWRLPTLDYVSYLSDWIDVDLITYSSLMQFNKENSFSLSVWLSNVSKTNPSDAYYGYSSSSTYPKENDLFVFPIKVDKPYAVAGTNSETTSNSIDLNGSLSMDAITGTTTYKWEVVKNNVAGELNASWPIIDSPNSLQTTVTLPGNGDNTTYKFRLTLTRGEDISTDEIEVTYKADITKLSADGSILSYGAQEYACIKDNASGLVWQVIDDIANASTYTFAQVNSGEALPQGLCGVSTWRIPTLSEFDAVKKKDYITQGAKVLFDYSFYMGDERHYGYWLNDSSGEYTNLMDDTQNYGLIGRMYDNNQYEYQEYRMTDKLNSYRVWAVGEAQ